jgi:hypothetical protein
MKIINLANNLTGELNSVAKEALKNSGVSSDVDAKKVGIEDNADLIRYKDFIIGKCKTRKINISEHGDVNDVILKTLSFERDPAGDYIAGFWGDSGVGHAIPGSDNVTYEDIKTGFIPFLIGKTYAQLSSYDGFVDKKTGISYDDTVFAIPDEEFNKDMEGVQIHGEQVTLDHFNGASVSTNNILRMLLPLMEYHAANNI